MKIGVVGGGGREHAIIKALRQSPAAGEIYALPGNGGIAKDAICVPEVKATDLEGVLAFAKAQALDYVVVAPDDPLALGMVDALSAAGIPAFGPCKAAAEIESSKVFAKNLMRKYGIPTASYEVFTDSGAARAYVEDCPLPIVLKADGLALGKGVLIAESREEARAAVASLMEEKKFGHSGDRIVIEDFLTGPEVSVLSFTDGKTIVPMISSMDHKRALDGDRGLNTGGMGAVAPNPFYTEEIAAQCMERIFKPTIAAMQAEGRAFKGCLYFGLMLCPDGPKVIEYNCRFGDPETQVVLPLLDMEQGSDLLSIMKACTEGTLDQEDIRWKGQSACCVVLASGGYPGSYQSGYEITGIGDCPLVYVAGAEEKEGRLYTKGGRVLSVVRTAPDLAEAVRLAYEDAGKIYFTDMHMRHDIGKRALEGLSHSKPEKEGLVSRMG